MATRGGGGGEGRGGEGRGGEGRGGEGRGGDTIKCMYNCCTHTATGPPDTSALLGYQAVLGFSVLKLETFRLRSLTDVHS